METKNFVHNRKMRQTCFLLVVALACVAMANILREDEIPVYQEAVGKLSQAILKGMPFFLFQHF